MTVVVQRMLDGELVSGSVINGGIADGFVDIVGTSSLVPAAALALVAEGRRMLQEAGSAEAVFCGPIYDNKDVLRVAAGECLSRDGLAQMTWLAKGGVELPPFQPT